MFKTFLGEKRKGSQNIHWEHKGSGRKVKYYFFTRFQQGTCKQNYVYARVCVTCLDLLYLKLVSAVE